jgi:hypothetical protein
MIHAPFMSRDASCALSPMHNGKLSMSHVPIIAASLASGMGAAFVVAARCATLRRSMRKRKAQEPFWVEVAVPPEAQKRPGESLAALRARRAAEELGGD